MILCLCYLDKVYLSQVCVCVCVCVGRAFEGFENERIKVKGLVKYHFFNLSTTREEILN